VFYIRSLRAELCRRPGRTALTVLGLAVGVAPGVLLLRSLQVGRWDRDPHRLGDRGCTPRARGSEFIRTATAAGLGTPERIERMRVEKLGWD
jgi:hypothetical protein